MVRLLSPRRGSAIVSEEDDDFSLTRREAAEYLGVHYNTIVNYEQQGRIRSQRVLHGKQEEARLSRGDVEALRVERETAVRRFGAEDDALALRERIASLETEVKHLRERLTETLAALSREQDRGDRFVRALVELASGRGNPGSPEEVPAID